MKSKQELFGVPELEYAESPCSWITRLALAQGATVKDLSRYLQLPSKTDIDLVFTRENIRRISRVCGMEAKEFSLIRTMMTGLMSLDRHGRTYLLYHNKSPRYRYCPVCLFEQRTKCFPIHWRFKAWRWCPNHMCMMEDHCPHCCAHLCLPADMLTSGPKNKGVAFLDRCLQCDGLLSHEHDLVKGTLNDTILAPWEKTLMDNGRALLASLYTRQIWLGEHRLGFSVRGIRRIEKQGLLPHDHFDLESSEIGRRNEVNRSLIERENQL